MRALKNRDGIALVTSLLLTLLSLAMIMVLMSYVLQGISTSASSKRYKNTLEASYGGAELVAKEIIPQFFNFTGASSGGSITTLQARYNSIGLSIASNSCLNQKLNTKTGDWLTAPCGAVTMTNLTNQNPKIAPDMTFTLKANLSGFTNMPGYRVYAKIVDTAVVGNTYKSSVDYSTKNPGDDRNDGSPNPIPSLYTVAVSGERETNPQEKTMLEVLYSY